MLHRGLHLNDLSTPAEFTMSSLHGRDRSLSLFLLQTTDNIFPKLPVNDESPFVLSSMI